MFKKKITYFVLYFLEGNSNNKYSVYMTSNVESTNSSEFNLHFNNQCKLNYEENTGLKTDEVVIESIQMISIQVSLFGWRIF
jgi:hypothetical protein